MSTTTDSSATMAGAANPESSPATAPGDALAAQVQALTPAQKQKVAAMVDLDKVEAILQRRRAALADVKAKYAAMQAEVAQQTATNEGLNQQVAQLQAEVESLQAAKAQLEADAQKHAEELEVIDQKTADLQAQLNEAESERLKLQGELDAIKAEMPAPAAAAEGDTLGEGESAAAGEAPQASAEDTFEMTEDGTIVETTERTETMALEPELAGEPTVELPVEPELAGEPTQETALEPELAGERTEELPVEPELAGEELDALKLQLDAALADRDSAQAMIDERDGELVALRAQLAALTAAPPPKQVSDFKTSARASAVNLGVEPRGITEMQDLADVKHIGSTYEQRLYRAGVGTYWEVAHLTNDDFELILRLTPMQSLAMNVDEARAAARQLAEDSESVGAIWEGDVPDDFEPIPGIGKVFEQRLYDAGIRTYKDLANASAEQLADICKARKPIQPDYAGWVRQARKLMEIRNA